MFWTSKGGNNSFMTQYIPYVPASLGPVRRSIWGGYWAGIFLKLSPPEFLCLASLNLKFGAKIPKTVDFFLTANFWWSILAGSKIDAIPNVTTCSLPNIYSLKALPLAAYRISTASKLYHLQPISIVFVESWKFFAWGGVRVEKCWFSLCAKLRLT